MSAANGNGTSTAVAVREPIAAPAIMSDREIDQTFRVAKALAMSGMFKDTKQAEQAFAKILVGRDLGLSPTQAMLGIHIIEGKPELSANLQAAFVKRTPGYDYKVTKLTEKACEVAFLRDGEEVGRSRFTMEDATRAGLANRGPWKSFPRNMLFARAMTNGVAFFVPEVTGGIRVYSEGEIGGEETPPALEPAAAEPTDATTAEEPAEEPAGLPAAEAINEGAIRQLNDALNTYMKGGGEFDAVNLQALALGGELDDGPDAPNLWHLLTAEQGLALYEWMQEQAA